jgi:hypothetical protein
MRFSTQTRIGKPHRTVSRTLPRRVRLQIVKVRAAPAACRYSPQSATPLSHPELASINFCVSPCSDSWPLFRQLLVRKINGHEPLLSRDPYSDLVANAFMLHEIILDPNVGSMHVMAITKFNIEVDADHRNSLFGRKVSAITFFAQGSA